MYMTILLRKKKALPFFIFQNNAILSNFASKFVAGEIKKTSFYIERIRMDLFKYILGLLIKINAYKTVFLIAKPYRF